MDVSLHISIRVSIAHVGQKTMLDSLELDFEMAVSYHVESNPSPL